MALKRGVMDYHNNVFIARNLGWRIQGAPIPEDFLERQRRAALAMTLEVRAWPRRSIDVGLSVLGRSECVSSSTCLDGSRR